MKTTTMISRTFLPFFLFVVLLLSGLNAALAQQKLAQTGMKFLNLPLDARAVAMGEAVTALEGSSSSMFFNTAGMARQTSLVSFSLGRTKWIADINHLYGSIAVAPFDGDYGVLGFTIQSVDYGEIQETIRANNAQGFIDIGTFKPSAMALGVGYARALSDKFSVGGNVKYVTQDLGESVIEKDTLGNYVRVGNKRNVTAFDLGILYRTGYKSLNFGMTVKNFAREIRFQSENFQLPLTFKIGVSMDLVDLTGIDKNTHSLLLAIEAEHPRDYPEQVKYGIEYVFMKTLALRAGYVNPTDRQGWALGLGVQRDLEAFWLAVDYAYMPFENFDAVHRLSFQFSL